jgi:intracellular septation protein
LLSYLLGEQIKLSDEAWIKLSQRFSVFFIFLALLNEVIWRNFSTEFWVNFKVFGMMTISFIFTISQASFIISENKKITNNDQ